MIKNQYDLQQAAVSAAIAIDDVLENDRLKSCQTAIAAFSSIGIDDANFGQFEQYFNQARSGRQQRIGARATPIVEKKAGS